MIMKHINLTVTKRGKLFQLEIKNNDCTVTSGDFENLPDCFEHVAKILRQDKDFQDMMFDMTQV